MANYCITSIRIQMVRVGMLSKSLKKGLTYSYEMVKWRSTLRSFRAVGRSQNLGGIICPLYWQRLTYLPKYGGKSSPPQFLGSWVGWHRHMNVGYDELQVKRFHACPPDCLSTFQIYKWILNKNNSNWKQ